MFHPVLDTMIGEMERRFSDINCNILKGIQALNPSSCSFLREEEIVPLSSVEDLKHELHQVGRDLDRLKMNGKEKVLLLMEFAHFLEPNKDVFFELFRLCKVAVMLPVSSATCERSFSALKIIKNHLRSTMAESRLFSLATISIESKRTKALNLDDFVKRCAEQHGNRRIQLL